MTSSAPQLSKAVKEALQATVPGIKINGQRMFIMTTDKDGNEIPAGLDIGAVKRFQKAFNDSGQDISSVDYNTSTGEVTLGDRRNVSGDMQMLAVSAGSGEDSDAKVKAEVEAVLGF